MKPRCAIRLFVIFLFWSATANAQPQCDCTLYPRQPPECVKICASLALRLASSEELKVNLRLDAKTVAAVESEREKGPITSVDELRKVLTTDQYGKLQNALNSEDVKPIFSRTESILSNASYSELVQKYSLDRDTIRVIINARMHEPNGRVTMQDLAGKLDEKQINKVAMEISKAGGV